MKRREFVIKGTLASAAITTSAFAANSIISLKKPSETINIGVIGTGDRGCGMIPNINKIPNFNVIACCDTLPYRLEKGIGKVKGKAKGYSDYRKLLDNKEVDAILVATPFNTHSKIAIDALDADKHVYCEKTMAKGYEGIKNLIDRVEGTKTIFQTGHQYHSSKLYAHIVDLIKDGKIGKVIAFECQWNRHGDWRREVPSPELERAVNWRMYREYSGGLIAELCSHQIDFANWVLDDMPTQVMGAGGVDYWKDGRETYDNIHLIYNYSSGVKATFTCLTSNAKDGYKIRVKGDKGTLVLEYAKAWFYPEGDQKKDIGVVDGVSGATVKWEQGLGIPIEIPHIEPSEQALIDFRKNIIDNKEPISNITTGANAAICIQMGLDAMYQNKIVQKPIF